MVRFLFSCAAALSLLLLVGTVVLWVWNRSHSGYIRLHEGPHFVVVHPAPNAVTITSWNDPAAIQSNYPRKLNSVGTWPPVTETLAYLVNRNGMKWKHLGVQWSVLSHLDHGRSLMVPDGMLLALFALLPLWWAANWNRSRKLSGNPKEMQTVSAVVCA